MSVVHAIDRFFRPNLTIKRRTRTATTPGRFPEQLEAVADAIRGRVRPATQTERVAGDQREGVVTHVVYVHTGDVARATGTELGPDDVVDDDSVEVRIRTVANPGGLGAFLQATAEEIQHAR